MKTLKIMLVGILLLGTASIYPLFNQSKGEAALTSMSLPVDAKSLSLGFANSVALDDASAIFNNPASINMDQKISFIANTNLWLKDSFHQFVGYTQKLNGIGIVGLGINYFSTNKGINFHFLEFLTDIFSVSYNTLTFFGNYRIYCYNCQ